MMVSEYPIQLSIFVYLLLRFVCSNLECKNLDKAFQVILDDMGKNNIFRVVALQKTVS